VPEWIVKYWAEWLFSIVVAALAVAYKRLASKVKAQQEERKALKEGVLAILHDRLYQSCRYYIKQGWVDVEGLKNIEYLYKSYHALGGNGTGTELYNRVKALPIKGD
jgi:hypothetical protein